MNAPKQTTKPFEIEGMTAALRRAAKRALELGRRTGTPVWIMRDGKLVNALADEQELAARNGEQLGD